jgi:hypothetical protein
MALDQFYNIDWRQTAIDRQEEIKELNLLLVELNQTLRDQFAMAALTCSAGDVTKAYKIADQMLEERLNNDKCYS